MKLDKVFFFFFVVVPKWAFIVIESQLLPINLIYYTRLSISSTKKCLIQNNVVYWVFFSLLSLQLVTFSNVLNKKINA